MGQRLCLFCLFVAFNGCCRRFQVTFKGGGDAPAPVVRRVTFSCPVVDAAALGDAGDRHGIVLKKAMLEPWPCDWNDDRGQWDVHELPEWTSRAQLSIHLSSQFQFRDLHDHADASKSVFHSRPVRCRWLSLDYRRYFTGFLR